MKLQSVRETLNSVLLRVGKGKPQPQNPPSVIEIVSGQNIMARKLPVTSPSALQFYLRTNKQTVLNFILDCLRIAITSDADRAELFELGESQKMAVIVRENYDATLWMMEQAFLSTEQYELIGTVRKLRDRNYIHSQLRESRLRPM
jgi:hypothetical protein